MMPQLFFRIGDMVLLNSFLLPQPRHTYLATVVMAILEIKIIVCACLLSSEGCDSFPKHLDLALAPNKTNKEVKKQWNTQ
jgi:hypothetical protein